MKSAKTQSLADVQNVHEGRISLRDYLQTPPQESKRNPYLLDLCFDVLRTAQQSQHAITVLQSDALWSSDTMDELLLELLDSDWSRVRWQTLRRIRQTLDDRVDGGVLQSTWARLRLSSVVTADPSWMNRQEATYALSDLAGEFPDCIAWAATDPHWRVRDAVAEVIQRNPAWQAAFLSRSIDDTTNVAAAGRAMCSATEHPPTRIANWRADGVRRFLLACDSSDAPAIAVSQQAAEASEVPAVPAPDTPETIAVSRGMFWDWDPSVLAREITGHADESVEDWTAFIASYVGHHDERVQRAALQRLAEPTTSQMLEVLKLLDDVRHPASHVVTQWAKHRDRFVRAETRRVILRSLGEQPSKTERHDAEIPSTDDRMSRHLASSVRASMGQVTWALSDLATSACLEELEAEVQRLLDVGQRLPATVQVRLAQLLAVLASDEASTLNGWSRLFDADHPETRTASWLMLASWATQWPLDLLDNVLVVEGQSLERLSTRAGTCIAPQCEFPRQRAAAARFVATVMSNRDPHGVSLPACISDWVNDPSWLVRLSVADGIAGIATRDGGWNSVRASLQSDACTAVRAAAIDAEGAHKLLEHPEQETSWLVLQAAALRTKRPAWKILPAADSSSSAESASAKRIARPNSNATSDQTVSLKTKAPIDGAPHFDVRQPDGMSNPAWTPLGRFGNTNKPIQASRIAISGHYGLPPRGFSEAVQAGVNLFFWEPGYTTMSQFCCEQTASAKTQLHFMAGTFKATGDGIRKDAHRALRLMRLERLTLFFLFWTRGWGRMTDDALKALEQLVADGDLLGYSLSTHDRDLACEAIGGHRPQGDARQWNPIMVRYSAAHRGAEAKVLPAAMKANVSIITFNNTCYGRLLQPLGGQATVTAADCYRFALAHPAVTVSLSAPSSLEQLEENLEALHRPSISEEQLGRMRSHGDRVYEQDQRFDTYIRRR